MKKMKKIYKQGYTVAFFMLIIPLVIVLLLSGCASRSVYHKKGMQLFGAEEYDKAVAYFEKSLKRKPSQELRMLLFRARLNSYFYHLARARSLREVDKKEEAIKEYKIALKLFPDNRRIIDELDIYINGKKAERPPFRSTIKPPVTLDVDAAEKMDLKLRNTPVTKIFNVVGKSYGVNFIFDKDFRDFVYTIEVEDTGFYDILNQLCMISSAEYRILDRKSVLIYPNTTFKKRTFGLRGVKVFYLSNVAADDAKKLLMTVFRDEQIQVQEDKNLNSLIIKCEYSTMVDIEKFLYSVDKRKSEVIIDVQVLEVTKNFVKALGASFGDARSPAATLTPGVVDSEGKVSSTMNINDIGKTNFFLTIPSVALSFLESDDKNRIIARPNLRGVDGEEIKFLVGDEVPVPQTQFQAAAAGGISNVPVTTYQYKNVGVEVKLTPYIHHNNEVTIKVKLTIKSIAGYENGFPTFGTREVENIIRLKEGETNIIGGFIKDEVRGGVKGITALSRIPILGKLFGVSGKEVKQTDVIFSVTPHIIRRMDSGFAEEETIWSSIQGGFQGEMAAPEAPREPRVTPGGNSLMITPGKRRVPVGSSQFFTIRVNTGAELASLTFSGSVSGAKAEIEDVKADFFGSSKVQVFKNFSGNSFDLGYTFTEGSTRGGLVAQLKIKFLEKGSCNITISSVNAAAKDQKPVELNTFGAEIEVY
jgi:general secretion pathway protein D